MVRRARPVPVLHACGVDDHREQKLEGVGQHVALATEHLLASVIAGRVERSPPLTAPRALVELLERADHKVS